MSTSHVQFRVRVHVPGREPSAKIERVQDAVCAARRAGPGARIISTTNHDVTERAVQQFGGRRCPSKCG